LKSKLQSSHYRNLSAEHTPGTTALDYRMFININYECLKGKYMTSTKRKSVIESLDKCSGTCILVSGYESICHGLTGRRRRNVSLFPAWCWYHLATLFDITWAWL